MSYSVTAYVSQPFALSLGSGGRYEHGNGIAVLCAVIHYHC